MHKFLKSFIFIVGMVISAGHMYGAAPAGNLSQKTALAAQTHLALVGAQAALSKLLLNPKDALLNEFSGYKGDTLQQLQSYFQDITINIKEIEKGILAAQPTAHPKQSGSGAAAAAAQPKAKNEQRVSVQAPQAPGAAMAAAVKPQQPVQAKRAEEFDGMGTNTMNFMHKHPKYMMAMRISNKVKALAEITAEKTKLSAFFSIKRNVTGVEMGLLGIFCNCSEGKLTIFVDYLKALIKGNGIQDFHRRFHVTSVSSNAHDAAVQMDLGQADKLNALLEQIVQGIK